MRKLGIGLVIIVLSVIGLNNSSFAHCEIPCGIYGDSVRVALIAEHIGTIEKSMKQISELSVEKTVDYNQLVRWVSNKEEHAKKIQEIATQYFMFQRIKLTDDSAVKAKNQKLLAKLHELCVYAMKAKQTTDLVYIEKMRKVLHDFSHLYFGKGHKHKH
ncbi:superoxide dismutase [Puteibacter caeruleilacunae]|nr:superoxide dismutase [Puteibacter caeruleilacunae]